MSESESKLFNEYLNKKYIHKEKTSKKIISELFEKYVGKNYPIRRNYYSDYSNHHLYNYFDELNERHFDGKLESAEIAWSHVRSRRLLGKWCDESNMIILSSYLNSRSIKTELVKYVLYHEMCHIAFPPFLKNGRRKVHHHDFRKKENEYPNKVNIEKMLSKI
jgi:predicted metal-dependent hydrolase